MKAIYLWRVSLWWTFVGKRWYAQNFDEIQAHSNSSITGNITSKDAELGGKLKGNVNSDKIKIEKTARIEGVLNQKTLSIEEGAVLKIKSETQKSS